MALRLNGLVVRGGNFAIASFCDMNHLALNYCFLDSAKQSDIDDLVAELTILKEVNKMPHPNVIRFVGGCLLEGTQTV